MLIFSFSSPLPAEKWRHSALLHLYQSVLSLGCLSTRVRHSLRQVITLGSATRTASRAVDFSAGALRAFPWFMAAVVATSPAEREACRVGLRECGRATVYQDNLKAAELVWARMDRTGKEEDWRKVVQEDGDGLLVAFMWCVSFSPSPPNPRRIGASNAHPFFLSQTRLYRF